MANQSKSDKKDEKMEVIDDRHSLSIEDAYGIFFDEDWYLRRNPAVRHQLARNTPGLTPLGHYQKLGYRLGFSPGPLIDPDFYALCSRTFNRDSSIDPIAHYLKHADKEAISPHWMFSEGYYRSKNPDVMDAISQGTVFSGFHHFISVGQLEGRRPHPLFQADWLNKQVRSSGPTRGLWQDFVAKYAFQGIVPTPLFDPEWYVDDHLRSHIGPNGAFVSAFHHFVTHGVNEGRSPLPDFDAAYYLATNSDVATAVQQKVLPSAVFHWIHHGIGQGRNPNRYFDSEFYLENNKSVGSEIIESGFLGAFDHFLAKGSKEGLQCNRPITAMQVDEEVAKIAFARKANIAANQLVSIGCLQFPKPKRDPKVSIVIPVHNNFDYTARLLCELQLLATHDWEVIVVDDRSTDATADLGKIVTNVKFIKNRSQLGFPGSCNVGIDASAGEYCLLLNNDIELGPRAVDIAVSVLDEDADIAAVGGKIIRTHGLLQEAGSIIWSDGSALGFGRDKSPNLPQFSERMDVDYCSACFLMLRRDLLIAVGRFDEDYAPGYYEEADLCSRLWGLGKRVVYEPTIYIFHFEYASFSKGRPPSASHGRIKAHRKLYISKNQEFLRDALPPYGGGASQYMVNRVRRKAKSILLIEDLPPLHSLGSGFSRANAICRELADSGCNLTVVTTSTRASIDSVTINRELPRVELVVGSDYPGGVHAFIRDRQGQFDVLWICRTHNGSRLVGVLADIMRWPGRPRIVFDTEAIAANRNYSRARVLGDEVWNEQSLNCAIEAELSPGNYCDEIISVNQLEMTQAVRTLPNKVHRVIGHRMSVVENVPGFSERTGILFVGAIHSEDSPNYDSLLWFVDNCWGRVREMQPDAELLIAGYWESSVPVPESFMREGIRHIGPQKDLLTLYNSSRLFIAPTRYAAGIPHKVHEAAAHGLPSVVSTLLADQLGWSEVDGVLACELGDASSFAVSCAEVYASAIKWQSLSAGALKAVSASCDSDGFSLSVRQAAGLV